MGQIDLAELSKRESERVEWKENVADIEDVIKTAVAFANDYSNLGGGYIVCGAKEAKDEHGFQKLIQKRILVFIIPATSDAHNYRSSGKDSSTYYVRIGRETREARNGILRELLTKKNQIEHWDKRINAKATLNDIDLLSLREYLKEMSLWDNNKPVEEYLSATESLSGSVPPLAGKENLSTTLNPRNFSLLLFSKDPLKYFYGAYTVVSVYNGLDRSEPTRITVFSDRIEIHSPGSLPRAIDKEKFVVGKANLFRRNQSLAYFFNKLQLAQAEGQGIPTIIRTMKEEGCPDPKFKIGAESVTCILPAHPRQTLIKNL